ncbi:MAG: response regulator, partial [Desulfobacteraceae bacterium]|nr:response regulator [Desulfobacteraceae bacterium]
VLGVKVAFSARDEIGEIGTVFNKMSETLLQKDTALKDAVKIESEYALKLKKANSEFKRLNIELEKANKALETLNADLEQTVQERTTALVESNISLQKEIDEKEKMKNELIRIEKLESIGLLAGGIAHDFNNILSVIIGNISLVQMHSGTEDKVAKLLLETEKSCFRARDLTKQLLTFSKGGAPVTKLINITELIKETVIFTLRGSNVGYEFSIAPDLFPVKVDEGQMNQVISNIVINASHAMPDGGIVKIKVRNKNIEPGSTFIAPLKTGHYIQISIHDHGIGIDKKDLQTIFDPYFTTKTKGSGLGLATSHSIIKKHEGFIAVKSQKIKGTTFHIYLPAFPGEIEEISGQAALSTAEQLFKGHGKVLIMDDEGPIRELLGAMLTHLGYEPDFAEDGVEACKKYLDSMASKIKFRAVIIDLTIPGGMGGKEAVQEILKIDLEAKAIVSSGYSNDPVMSDYKAYGFAGVVSKPFKMQELSAVLHKIL